MQFRPELGDSDWVFTSPDAILTILTGAVPVALAPTAGAVGWPLNENETVSDRLLQLIDLTGCGGGI